MRSHAPCQARPAGDQTWDRCSVIRHETLVCGHGRLKAVLLRLDARAGAEPAPQVAILRELDEQAAMFEAFSGGVSSPLSPSARFREFR